MNKPSPRSIIKAFTVLELLVVIAIVAILAALVLPLRSGRPRSSLAVQCMSNLRQVGIGFHIWANDHTNSFPMQASTNEGGSMELSATGSPQPHFQTITTYLRNPGVWVCPSDKSRQKAAPEQGLVDSRISYFVSLDAAPAGTNTPFMILAGDRHLQVAGQPVRAGLLTLKTNSPVGWTAELHAPTGKAVGGNLLFADGHVEFVQTNRIEAVIQRQPLAANRIAIP